MVRWCAAPRARTADEWAYSGTLAAIPAAHIRASLSQATAIFARRAFETRRHDRRKVATRVALGVRRRAPLVDPDLRHRLECTGGGLRQHSPAFHSTSPQVWRCVRRSTVFSADFRNSSRACRTGCANEMRLRVGKPSTVTTNSGGIAALRPLGRARSQERSLSDRCTSKNRVGIGPSRDSRAVAKSDT
jgi:hypothetical protein